MIVTFYSFKGGVGRTHSLVETAAQLAGRGHSVLVWDLDLEAPGMQRIPALRKVDKKLESGTLDLIQAFVAGKCREVPFDLLKSSIVSLDLPDGLAKNRGRLDFLLPCPFDQGYRERFAGIDWQPLLADGEMGGAFFLRIAQHLLDDLGYEYLLIDARTGLTDLGAISTLILPDLVVIVFNLNEQNLQGIRQAHAAIKAQRRKHGEIKVFLLANMVPEVAGDKHLEALKDSKLDQLRAAGLGPNLQLPLHPPLLLTDAIPSLDGGSAEDLRDQYQPLLDMLTRERASVLAEADEDRDERQLRPGLTADDRREILQRAKSFEEKVAELFRLLGYRAEVDDKTLDRQFDVRLELQGPITTYALVECKDTKRKVGIDDVVKFSRKVETASRHDKRRYQAILVAREGFANNARAVAEELFVELKSFKELRRSLVDLSPTLDQAIRDFQGTDLERLYVEQEAVWQRDIRPGEVVKPRGLTESVLAWLEEPASGVLTLLGDFGVGKSSFCQRLACLLALAHQQDPDQRAPVLIDLRESGSTTVTLENLLNHHFQRLSTRSFNPQAMLFLNRAGHLVLIFDGFDETIAYTEPGHYAENLRQMLRAVEGEAKVILTCRTHYFRDQPEEVQQLGVAGAERSTAGATALYEILRERPGAQIAYLREFEQAQIDVYLQKAVPPPGDWQELKGTIQAAYNLDDLAKRPFLLKLIVKSLAVAVERAQGAPLSIADLYEAYCEKWFEHNDLRLTLTREHKVALVHYLARMLWDASRQEVHYEELAEKALDFYRVKRELSYLDKERVDYEVRTALFLHRDSRGYYRFIHRSFLEYFVAVTVREGLAQDDATVLDLKPLTREVALFLLRWPEAENIPKLAGAVLAGDYRQRVSENALRLLYFLARDRALPADTPRDRAAEEEIDLAAVQREMAALHQAAMGSRPMRLEQGDLQGADLRGAYLIQASLKQANLRQAQLQGAKLDANLSSADLSSADLRGADLSDANLGGASLDHADLRHADLRRADLRAADLGFARFSGADLSDARFEPRRTLGTALLGARGLPAARTGHFGGLRPLLKDGHQGRVLALAYHPQEPILASAGAEGSILLWDTLAGTLLSSLTAHRGSVKSLAFSPDGKTLASASNDNTVKLWNPSRAKLIHSLEQHKRPVTAVAFSPDGKTLASASHDNTVKLWNPSRAKLIHSLEQHKRPVTAVAFSPDGKTLASASHDNTVKLWNPSLAKLIHSLEQHNGWVTAVAFSPDGKTLASASNDKTVRLWNPSRAKLIHSLEQHKRPVTAVAFSPDGKTLASASDDKTVKLWNPSRAKLIRSLEQHNGWVTAVAFSPDGKTLASASNDNTVKLWNPSRAKLIHSLEQHNGWVTAVAFSPDGKTLASASHDNTVKLWNPSRAKLIHSLEQHKRPVTAVAFSPDGKTLASASHDNTVKLWNPNRAKLIHSLEQHNGWVTAVAFSPDGKTLASASHDNTVKLWNPSRAKLIRSLEQHNDWVRAVAFSPDGKTLASASHDNTVKLWNPSRAKLIHSLEQHNGWVTAVAFSPDGKTLASASHDNTVKLWNPSRAKLIHSLEQHKRPVRAVAFSPDGKTLASASSDKTVKLWNPTTGRRVADALLDSTPSSLAWLPSSRALVIGRRDGVLSLYAVSEFSAEDRLLQPVAHLWSDRKGHHLAWTSEGYVMGDPEALERFRFVEGYALYEAEDLPDRLNPEKVLTAIARLF